jgi:predicted nucleotidyltransferase
MDPKRIAENLKQRDAEDALRIKNRVIQARQEIEALIERFLAIDPAVRRIVLFGSLVHEEVRNPHFDIDLAIDADQYYLLVAAAQDSVFRVDLVDLRNIRPAIGERIKTEGKVLYEAE